MNNSLMAFLLALGFGSTCLANTVEVSKIKTARGAQIDVVLNIPSSISGKAPAVIIAPGQGYHMDLPMIKGLAERLADQGIMAFRFNWNYYSTDPKNGQPSNDLSDEVQDMKAVVDLAKSDLRVNRDQILFAGKSLGSMVAYRVFKSETAPKGLMLLTPVCTSAYDDNDHLLPAPIPVGQQSYPDIEKLKQPVVMVLGNEDPNCSLPMLYDFLKNTNGNVSTVVVGGDHSWNLSAGNDPASNRRNSENISAGLQMSVHWAKLLFGI